MVSIVAPTAATFAQITSLPAPVPDQPTTRPAPDQPTTRPSPLPFPLPGSRPQPQPVPLPAPQPGSGAGQWERTITCASARNRYRECRVDAAGGAGLVRVLSGNCTPGNYGWRADAVWVNGGCRAEFGYNSQNWGDNWGGGPNWQIGTVRCESRNNRYQECRADARGGARLARVLGGDCRRQHWGYADDMVWVNRGCRADFEVRGAGPQPDQGGGGPSAGLIIGGIAVAAGLAALLASGGRKNDAPAASGQPAPAPPAGVRPAAINISTSLVPQAARASFQTCLNEAARQIGATGGTAIALEEMQEIEPGNGGYRFRFRLRGTWPDESRLINSFCRATADRVIAIDFS